MTEVGTNLIEIDENFETMLICAERYACGRHTYMPSIVVDYIMPLIPMLSDKTLTVMRNDITSEIDYGKLRGAFGMDIDTPMWANLRLEIVNEMKRREAK